ncbi:MAG: restriction endonuclease [Methanobacteriaceae archaeon]|nr:restriction endonuclease [Methanobacteriaceae archaeon]
MKKKKLVEFMAKIMEDSGFKVYKDFRTSRHLIDIYGVLNTVLGDIGVVVACKNYDERWNVGLDVLKEMEMVAKTLKASKVVIVTTSDFTQQSKNYAARRNIKLINNDSLLRLAKKFSKKDEEYVSNEIEVVDESYTTSIYEGNPGSSFVKSGKRGSLNRKRDKVANIFDPRIKKLLGNTIVLILIVLGLSWIISTIIGTYGKVDNAILGIIKIVFSGILSYGLVFTLERDITVTLLRGTTIFFVSLLILILLIIF